MLLLKRKSKDIDLISSSKLLLYGLTEYVFT